MKERLENSALYVVMLGAMAVVAFYATLFLAIAFDVSPSGWVYGFSFVGSCLLFLGLPSHLAARHAARAFPPPRPLPAPLGCGGALLGFPVDWCETAYHEAGHYVVARVVAPTVRRLGLALREDKGGVFLPSGRAEIRALVVMLYAGLQAELELLRGCGSPSSLVRLYGGARSDELQAARYLAQLGISPAQREQLSLRCRAEAARVVKQCWTGIEALAETLLRRGQLDGEAADLVLDEAAAGEELCPARPPSTTAQESGSGDRPRHTGSFYVDLADPLFAEIAAELAVPEGSLDALRFVCKLAPSDPPESERSDEAVRELGRDASRALVGRAVTRDGATPGARPLGDGPWCHAVDTRAGVPIGSTRAGGER